MAGGKGDYPESIAEMGDHIKGLSPDRAGGAEDRDAGA
jgi:hypothetical protein